MKKRIIKKAPIIVCKEGLEKNLLFAQKWGSYIIINVYLHSDNPKYRIFFTKHEYLTQELDEKGDHVTWRTAQIDYLTSANIDEIKNDELLKTFWNSNEKISIALKQSEYRQNKRFIKYLKTKKITDGINRPFDKLGNSFEKDFKNYAAPDHHFIFFKKQKQDLYACKCSFCNYEYTVTESVKHGEKAYCPHCKTIHEYKNKNLFTSNNSLYKSAIFVWGRFTKGKVILTEYFFSRTFTPDFEVKNKYIPLNRMIIEKNYFGNIKKQIYNYTYDQYNRNNMIWKNTGKFRLPGNTFFGFYNFKEYDIHYNLKNINDVLKRSGIIKNQIIESINYISPYDICDYLLYIEKNPTMKGFIHGKYYSLGKELYEQSSCVYDLKNEMKNKLYDLFDNPQRYTFVRQKNLSTYELMLYLKHNEKGLHFTEKTLRCVRAFDTPLWNLPSRYIGKIEKLINYIKKQTCEDYDQTSIIKLLFDYHEMMKQLLRQSKDFPSNLIEAHNEASDCLAENKRQLEREKLRNAVKGIHQRYQELQFLCEYTAPDYIIRPFFSLTEFYLEGKINKLCVYSHSYYEKYASRKTDLFLIRKKNALNECFCVFEVNEKEILQISAYNNKTPPKEVRQLVELWYTKKYLEYRKLQNNKEDYSELGQIA